jgi:hypothetical protein
VGTVLTIIVHRLDLFESNYKVEEGKAGAYQTRAEALIVSS